MSDSHSEGLKASSPAAAFSSAPPSAGLSDGPLQSQIENAIRRDPGLSGSRLSVHVAGNQVELSGTAPTGKEKETADRLARSFAVDRKVDNKVAVAGQGPGSTTLPEPASNAAAEKNPKPRRAANSTARAEQPQ
jgi:osmotically-inducible protein OsmY